MTLRFDPKPRRQKSWRFLRMHVRIICYINRIQDHDERLTTGRRAVYPQGGGHSPFLAADQWAGAFLFEQALSCKAYPGMTNQQCTDALGTTMHIMVSSLWVCKQRLGRLSVALVGLRERRLEFPRTMIFHGMPGNLKDPELAMGVRITSTVRRVPRFGLHIILVFRAFEVSSRTVAPGHALHEQGFQGHSATAHKSAARIEERSWSSG